MKQVPYIFKSNLEAAEVIKETEIWTRDGWKIISTTCHYDPVRNRPRFHVMLENQNFKPQAY